LNLTIGRRAAVVLDEEESLGDRVISELEVITHDYTIGCVVRRLER